MDSVPHRAKTALFRCVHIEAALRRFEPMRYNNMVDRYGWAGGMGWGDRYGRVGGMGWGGVIVIHTGVAFCGSGSGHLTHNTSCSKTSTSRTSTSSIRCSIRSRRCHHNPMWYLTFCNYDISKSPTLTPLPIWSLPVEPAPFSPLLSPVTDA